MSKTLKNSSIKTVVNIFISILFISFAFLQLNDPDPLVWFSIYLSIGIICLLINFINIPKYLIWTFSIGLIIYAGSLFPYFFDWLQIDHKNEVFGKMVYDKPYLEGTREFIGLVMGIVALLYQVVKKSK